MQPTSDLGCLSERRGVIDNAGAVQVQRVALIGSCIVDVPALELIAGARVQGVVAPLIRAGCLLRTPSVPDENTSIEWPPR